MTRPQYLCVERYVSTRSIVKLLVLGICVLNVFYYLFQSYLHVKVHKTVNRTIKQNPYAELGTPCNLKQFYLMPYPNDTLKYLAPKERRYVIYTCRGECGGLADQFKGVTAGYAISKRSGRALRIQETVKCGLTTYLRPKKYDWTYDQREIQNLNFTYCNTNNVRKTKEIKLNDYVLYLNESVIYLRTNRMYGDRDEEYKKIFRATYDDLFDLKRDIKIQLNKFKDTYVKDNKTVCAHLRVGKNPGFQDNKYNNLGNISEIWKFLSQYNKTGYVIYIATDSVIVREAARKRFPNRFIDMPGRVINTAFEADDDECSAFRKLILDFSFLTTCDVLLLTFSDFGFHASLLRETEGNQYCFQGGKVYQCPLYSIIRNRSSKEMNPLIDV